MSNFDFDNDIDFGRTAPAPPPEITYDIFLRNMEQPLRLKGYLVVTPSFVGIVRGPQGANEFHFAAPLGDVLYTVSVPDAKFDA